MHSFFFSLTLLATLLLTEGCQQKNNTSPLPEKGTAQKTVTHWTCPMHPQIKKEGPGTCPICGMNLIKVEQSLVTNPTAKGSEEGDKQIPITLTPYRQQLIGVTTTIVNKQEIIKTIMAPGKLAFDPELYTAIQEYREALRQYKELKGSSLPEVQRSQEQLLHSATLRLKLFGITTEQQQQLSKGDNLLLPSSRREQLVYADVFEIDLPYIHKGLKAILTGSALQGKKLEGEIVSIDPIINSATRSIRVRLAIKELPVQLSSDAYLDVKILSPQGEYIAVPFSAILTTGENSLVFVEEKAGHYVPRKVSIAFDAGDLVAIIDGVKEGEKIVTSSQFLIDAESRLQATWSKQTGESNAEHHH